MERLTLHSDCRWIQFRFLHKLIFRADCPHCTVQTGLFTHLPSTLPLQQCQSKCVIQRSVCCVKSCCCDRQRHWLGAWLEWTNILMSQWVCSFVQGQQFCLLHHVTAPMAHSGGVMGVAPRRVTSPAVKTHRCVRSCSHRNLCQYVIWSPHSGF